MPLGGEGKWGCRGRVRVPDVDIRRLSGLKFKLVCHFELAVDLVRGGIREFLNDTGRLAFLERELMGFDMDGYQ